MSNLEDMSELKSPKSPLEALDDALDLVMPSARFSIPIPPPRNKQKSGGKLKIGMLFSQTRFLFLILQSLSLNYL